MEYYTIPLKTCTKCNRLLPATPFFFKRFKRSKDGLLVWCKSCCAEYDRKRYLANKQQHNERTRLYYQENKDYRQDNAEAIAAYHKEYRRKNKSRIRAKQREWETKNREHVNAKARANHPKYRVQKSAYAKFWAFKNRDKRALYAERRRARVLNLPDTFTHEQWIACLEYFNYCCAVCGAQLRDLFGMVEPHQDHWIPLKSPDCLGTTADNMVCLCKGCNISKGAKLPIAWLNQEYGTRKAKQILDRIQAYFASLS